LLKGALVFINSPFALSSLNRATRSTSGKKQRADQLDVLTRHGTSGSPRRKDCAYEVQVRRGHREIILAWASVATAIPFLLVYRSAKNYTPGDPDVMASWQAFFEGLGGSLVDTENPIFARSALGDCETNTTVLGGYSIIDADDLDAAIALAEGCPVLTTAGGVEVGEITPLNPENVGTTVDEHARATGLAN
jgi:YCII-related domain